MCHDPELRSGHHAFEQLGVSIGWVSSPNSYAGPLPVWNEGRTVCLIFAGEEFSACDRAAELKLKGPACPRVDSSLLVHLYEEHGPEFVEHLNGWFAGLLVDLRDQKTLLFNDRYGLGRIYYHQSPDGFFFSSEAKSLLAVLPALRQIDQQGLGEFFSFGCVLQNRTLFGGISLLPPGSLWTFQRDGRMDRRRYFSPATWEQQEPLDAVTYGERLKEVFGRVAPRYLQGEEQVAMSLTGGLDSRMILAWAQAAPGSLPCYTFAGPYRDCADVRIARELAEICHQPHTTIRVGNEFFQDFPTLAEKTVYLSDGAMDVSGAAELYANRCAREIAPIRLTGNYGSEILRSIVAFRPGRLDESLFDRDFIPQLRTAEATYERESQGRRLSFIAFKQVPWHHYARLAVEQSQLTVRSPFLDNDLVGLAFRAPPELATGTRHLLQIIAEGNPALAWIGTDRAFRQRSIPIVSWLSHSFQEFTAKAEYAYDYGMPQWLAKVDHALRPLHLEKLFLGRHKFCHFRVWYRDSLAEFVRAVLLDPRALARPHLDGRRVEQMVTAHLRGQGNYTQEIHKLLTCELTYRLLIERN
jgi:asparagine synthase (glutamine-hydrolysing)